MKTTRLADFSEEQLNLIAKTMIWKQLDIKDQIAGSQVPGIAWNVLRRNSPLAS